MNEHQTAQFAVGMSMVAICLILGLIITEMARKLARTRDELERVRRLASKSYSHRKCLEDAVFDYVEASEPVDTRRAYKLLQETAKWSKEDNG